MKQLDEEKFTLKNKIYYGKQDIDKADIQAVIDVLESPTITQGPENIKLEKALCEKLNSKYAVAVANGTAALHMACIAAGISKGDEIITTPLTFAASANCAFYVGAKPIFADVCRNTYMIDPDDIERKITPRTKAVIAVDYTGECPDYNRIREICDKHNLILIEDAAHSIGSYFDGMPVGSFADFTTFSFHPVKTITGGEGGAVLTNNEDYFKKLALFKTHGMEKDPENFEYESHGFWYMEQQELGYNYRLTDFQAALVSSQLKKLDRYAARRREIQKKYDDAFSKIPQLFVQQKCEKSDACRHLYVLGLRLEKLRCNRKQFGEELSKLNIQPMVHYIPVYLFPYYQRQGYKKGLCPVAEEIYETILSIPFYPTLSDTEIDMVINAITMLVQEYKI